MFKLLDILLRRIVRRGSLTLIDADGTSHRFGDGRPPGVVVRLADNRLARQLVTDPELALDALAWRLFHEEHEVRTLTPVPLARGCRCSPDYVRSVIARFPVEERAAMVGDDGTIRVDCAFCATSFPIDLETTG